MKYANVFRLIASALIFAMVICAAVCTSAQAEKSPPKKLADVVLFGYHLFQTWDEVKGAFLEEATKDPYADYPVPYIADITWEYAGLSCPGEITLRLKGGLVQGIRVDVIGTGGDAEEEGFFNVLIQSFTDQGLAGERIDEVIDGEPLWEWSFEGENANVWWKPGESAVHADIEYTSGDVTSPLTGALGLEFGATMRDVMKSLPFGIAGDSGARSSLFKSEKTVAFEVTKSMWPEVFGADAPAGEAFTFTLHFLKDRLASAEVSFGFDEKAYASLQGLLTAQYGPPFIDSLSEYRERRWKDVFSRCEITMQMSDGLDAWVEWTTEEYWQADADSLMGEG